MARRFTALIFTTAAARPTVGYHDLPMARGSLATMPALARFVLWKTSASR